MVFHNMQPPLRSQADRHTIYRISNILIHIINSNKDKVKKIFIYWVEWKRAKKLKGNCPLAPFV